MLAQEVDALLDPANVEARLVEEQFFGVSLAMAGQELENAIIDDEEDKDWINRIKELPWVQQPAPMKINFALFVVGLGMAINAPLKQVILYKLACQSLVKNTPDAQCDPIRVQELVTNYQMWENVILPLVLIATTVQVCRMLDIYGRKFFITLFTVCLFCGEMIYYIAVSRSTGMPVWWMWLSVVVSLCAGGFTGISALCKAYVTDICKPSELIHCLGLGIVGISLGQLAGPLVSSFILKIAKKRDLVVPGKNSNIENAVPRLELVPLKAGLILLVFLILYNYFLLPESRSPLSRSKSRSASIALTLDVKQLRLLGWKQQIILFFRPLKILFYPDEFKTRENQHRFGRDRMIVIILSGCEGMSIVLAMVEVLLSPQYCIHKFHWDSVTLSYSMFANGLATTFVLVAAAPFVLNRLLPRLGFKLDPHAIDSIDSLVIVVTMVVFTICLIGQAFSPNTGSFVGFSVVQQIYCVGSATITAAVVKYFPASKIGELYGAISLAQGVTTLVFPIIFSQLFTYGVRHEKPQLPFFAVAVLSIGMVLAGLIMKRLSRASSVRL